MHSFQQRKPYLYFNLQMKMNYYQQENEFIYNK